ncbi:MAG: hypothetical protein ABWY03_01010 [Microbacterium sp.]
MGEWHPIMAAVEGPTGTWTMCDAHGDEYGRIEIRRVLNGTEVRYRAERAGELLGWDETLRRACERVHRAFLRAHGPQGGPVASWGRRDDR